MQLEAIDQFLNATFGQIKMLLLLNDQPISNPLFQPLQICSLLCAIKPISRLVTLKLVEQYTGKIWVATDCSITGSIGNDNNNESTRTQLNTTTTSIIHTRMTMVQHACVNHYMVTSHDYIIRTCHYNYTLQSVHISLS